MKIAQIAPLAESVPPQSYGGTERVVSNLTEELVRLGHDVTLFASADSITTAELVPCCEIALRLNPSIREHAPYHIMMLDKVMRRVDEFDVLHFHIDLFQFPLIHEIADRTVTTLHGRLDLPDLHPFYAAFADIPIVSISKHQRLPMPPVNWVGCVYHGVPTCHLPFTARPRDGYLAFLGRICPEKRPDRAIEIAARAGLRLKIAAKIDIVDRQYWKTVIAPLIERHSNVEFIGEITDAQKGEFLGNARALLFPIDWPEPFGLVMIEAMACGTPVIAYKAGSVPEVIEHGISGFLVDDIDGAVSAISRLGAIDRTAVRRRFDERFTVQRMAMDYLSIYRALPGVCLSAPLPDFADDLALRADRGRLLTVELLRNAQRAEEAGFEFATRSGGGHLHSDGSLGGKGLDTND